jgi:hypothetical protein
MIISLNQACGDQGIDENLLSRTFEREWKDLDKALTKLREDLLGGAPVKSARPQGEMLEEVLSRVRSIERQLVMPPLTGPGEGDRARLSDEETLELVKDSIGHYADSAYLQSVMLNEGGSWQIVFKRRLPHEVESTLAGRLAYRGVRANIVRVHHRLERA